MLLVIFKMENLWGQKELKFYFNQKCACNKCFLNNMKWMQASLCALLDHFKFNIKYHQENWNTNMQNNNARKRKRTLLQSLHTQ